MWRGTLSGDEVHSGMWRCTLCYVTGPRDEVHAASRNEVHAFLLSSDINKPSGDWDSVCEVCDRCLCEMAAKHAPPETRVLRRPSSRSVPWYNHECLLLKAMSWRLYKIYRTTHTTAAVNQQWRYQSTIQQAVIQWAHADHWRASCRQKCSDSRSLWRKVGTLLRPASAPVDEHFATSHATLLQQGERHTRTICDCSSAGDPSQRSAAAWTLSGAYDGRAHSKLFRLHHINHGSSIQHRRGSWSRRVTSGVYSGDQWVIRTRLFLNRRSLERNNHVIQPTWNLYLISKLIERLAVNRWNVHANLFELLPVQSVCLPTISLHQDLGNCCTQWQCSYDQASALVLLDLSAVLDAVDHRLLMDVLSSRFEIDDHVYRWLHSYLSGPTQIFRHSDICDAITLICVVPQGSVVGPLLFITYTEDVQDRKAQSSGHYRSLHTQKTCTTWLTLFLSRTTYMQTTPSCSHVCNSRRCFDAEEISRDVLVKSKTGSLRNGDNLTQIKPKNYMVRIKSKSCWN